MPSSVEVVSLGSGGRGPMAEGAIGGDERLSLSVCARRPSLGRQTDKATSEFSHLHQPLLSSSA